MVVSLFCTSKIGRRKRRGVYFWKISIGVIITKNVKILKIETRNRVKTGFGIMHCIEYRKKS